MTEQWSPVDGSGWPPDNINRGTMLLGWTLDENTLVEKTLVEKKNSQMNFSKRKTFNYSLARSVMSSNIFLFVLFSVNVLFQLNQLFMFFLSCFSIIPSLFMDMWELQNIGIDKTKRVDKL